MPGDAEGVNKGAICYHEDWKYNCWALHVFARISWFNHLTGRDSPATMADEKSSIAPTTPIESLAAEPLSEKQLEGLQALPIDLSRTSGSGPAAEAIEAKGPEQTWYHRLPLGWPRKPAVPAERQPSGEGNAGFLSLLVFHWIAPIMHVCLLGSAPPS